MQDPCWREIEILVDGRKEAAKRSIRRCFCRCPGWGKNCARRGRSRISHIFNHSVRAAQNRDDARDQLTERCIGREIYYPEPLICRVFARLNNRRGIFPNRNGPAPAETLALAHIPELNEATQLAPRRCQRSRKFTA